MAGGACGTGIVCLNPSRDRKGAGQLCLIASILCKKTNATDTGRALGTARPRTTFDLASESGLVLECCD